MRHSALIVLTLVCIFLPGGGFTQDKSAPAIYAWKADDDLLKVAEQLRPQPATINQMGLALVKANLKALQTRATYRPAHGTKLIVPDEKTVMSVDAATAEREFNKLWRADQHYRAGLALERSKDKFYAFVSYVEAAKLGNGRAQLRVAQLYDNDLSGFVQHDLQESAQWYEKARENQVEFATQRGRPQTLQGGI